MNKAVFLDRDGVINREIGDYVYTVSDFKINDGIIESLRLLSDNNFLIFVISNQGGIAKGRYTFTDVERVHNYLKEELQKHKIELTEIYYCAHHTDADSHCLCRKPDSVMLEKAIARFDINTKQSYMIGDRDRDVEAGQKAGLKTIKIRSNDNILEHCKNIINNAN